MLSGKPSPPANSCPAIVRNFAAMQTNSDFFEQCEQLTVLIVGDVMIDRYLTGRVDRISPEAPVPVVNYLATDNRLGGAANVALNVAAMGATPILCSVVGSDENGELFQTLLSEQQMNTEGLLRSDDRPTTIKTRVLAGSQQLLRVDREITDDLSRSETERFTALLEKLLAKHPIDAILLQDYNKGVLTETTIGHIIALARQRNIPVSVDPKRRNFWAYQQAKLFKPNLKEVREGLNQPIRPVKEDLCAAATELNHRLGNELTLITLSEHGVFIDDRRTGTLHPTTPRTIADVCGAGDTVISVATLAMAAGLPATSIAQLANLAGGQVCERAGVVPVDREQLRREFERIVDLQESDH